MPIILPESYGDEFAFSADDALHPEFWEPYRPMSVFCPLLGPTGNRLIDYSGGTPMTINNYSASMWTANGLAFNGTTNNRTASRTTKYTYPFTTFIISNRNASLGTVWGISPSATNYNTAIGPYQDFKYWVRDQGTTNRQVEITVSNLGFVCIAGVWQTTSRSIYYNGNKETNSDGASGNTSFEDEKLGVLPDLSPNYYLNGKIKLVIVYDTLVTDQEIYNNTNTLQQDPLAPFRKRPVRRYFSFSAPTPTATRRKVIYRY